eukprot:INCI17672.2.p1 GENE.INCI17672.2~~INCI17672.2.p1  ORF type:complete len:527 (+),score=64.37 INCI17672.2:356-1936(+)
MCSKTLLVALLLLAATQNAAIMPSLRNRNDFYNDSRNDPSGVTAATVAAAAAAAAATTWRASSINHTDNSGSQNASNHISLQSLRSLRAGRSDASQQSLVSLEKFCARTLLPHVSHRGDSLLRVSANLKAVLPNQLTIDELNKTLLAEARQLGITINPPGWSSSRSDTTLQHSDANAAQKILTRVWTQAGIVDRDTIAFLERALGFCRSASLATERLPSGFEHHRFCRRVGFVHIPKTGGSSIMHVLSNISLAYNPRMLLTSKKLYIGMHHMFSRTGRPMKNHQTALRQALHFGETTWDNAYTFAALRDPFDLVVSHFMYTAGYRCAHEPVIHALSPIDIAFACANLLGEPNRWDLSTLFSVTSEFGSLGGAASVSKLDIQRAFFNLWLLSHDIKASAPPREVTASAGAGLNLTKAPFGFLCDSYSICKVPQHVWQFVADNLIDKSHPQTDRHAQKADHDDNRAYVGANLETRVRQILEQTGGLEFSASQYSWVRDVQPEIGLGTMHRKLLVDEVRSQKCNCIVLA